MTNSNVEGGTALSTTVAATPNFAAQIKGVLAATTTLIASPGLASKITALLAASTALLPTVTSLSMQVRAILAAQTSLMPFPSVPRRTSGPNLFAAILGSTITNPLPPSAPTPRISANQPFVLFIPLNKVPNSSIDSLLFTRPDGTQYSVDRSVFFAAPEFAIFHIIYAVQLGEFAQFGWWSVQYVVGDNASKKFSFYVWPGQI